MRVPYSLVWDALIRRYSLNDEICPEPERMITAPSFFPRGIDPDPSRLYLSDVPLDPASADRLCVVYTDASGTMPVQSRALTLPVPLNEAADFLYSLWADIDRWREQLDRIVLTGGSLRELLQCAQKALLNPIVVYGSDFSLLAHAGLELLPEEWNVFDEQNGDPELFSALSRDLSLDRKHGDGRPFFLPPRVLPYQTCNLSFYRGGNTPVRVSVIELARRFSGFDSWILTFLEPYIGCLLSQESQTRGSFGLHTVLQEVMESRRSDSRELSRSLSRLGWLKEDRYQCLVLIAGLSESGSVARVDAFLERMIPSSCCLYWDDKLVCFLHLSASESENEELYGKIRYFIRENFLKGGYSRSAVGHGDLYTLFLQSCAALELGLRKNPDLWIHHFDSLAFDYLLDQSVRAMPVSLICHTGILRLREHDEARGTDYLRTLRLFLDTDRNAVQTARELFIHRSTLLYRLDRIRELLDSDLEDASERCYLSLSLRLLEHEHADEGKPAP